jgi:hypothetical protein
MSIEVLNSDDQQWQKHGLARARTCQQPCCMQVNFAMPQEALRNYGVHGHIFADTGSITLLSGEAPAAERLEAFWNQWRLAVGMGIKVPFGLAGHFEVNFVQPLASYGEDAVRPGLQVGFSSDPYLRTPPSTM